MGIATYIEKLGYVVNYVGIYSQRLRSSPLFLLHMRKNTGIFEVSVNPIKFTKHSLKNYFVLDIVLDSRTNIKKLRF